MKKRDIYMALAVVGLTVCLGLFLLSGRAQETASWGLSFRAEGQSPVGNADQAELAKYDAAFLGNTGEKVLYLTFDAGYENGCTAKILDILQEKNVPAAFFLVGNYLEKNPDLVNRMVRQGHTVGNHTMHHPDLESITDRAAFQKELTDLEALYRQVTGQELEKFYRPPRGIYSKENLQAAKDLGYKTVLWSLAYVDWYNDRQPTREQAFEKLLPRTHPGAVVLLHSTSQTNAQILGELIDRWRDMGYRFERVDALFTER